MGITESINAHKSSGPPSLTGSDLKSDTLTITITGAELTSAEINSPLKLKFRPAVRSVQPERGEIDTYFPNKTSAKTLVKMFGDDEKKLVGKKIKLIRVPRINPQTNQETMGLLVSESVGGKKK